MKVTQVSTCYLPIAGGQETYIDNLHHVLVKNRCEARVLQPFIRNIEIPDHVTMMFHIPKITRWIDHFFVFNFKLRFYKNRLKKNDVVISHYPFHYPVLKWHPRVIVLSHGLDWHDPPVTPADKYRVRSAQMCREMKPFLVANDTHFLRNLGHDVGAASSFFKQVDEKTWFIPNCVDTGRFNDRGLEREKIILVPRNVRKERGIHLAIEAFARFHEKHPDFTMHIAGGYSPADPYYHHCLDLIEKYRIQDNIRFLGSIPWNQLSDHYNMAMLTLIPTIEMEGTSLSALESMACRTPVVSTNAGGLCDLPTLKSSFDPDEMAGVLDQAVMQHRELAAVQYDQVRAIFNLENWEKAWMEVINAANNS